MRYFFQPPPPEPEHVCECPGCTEPGDYKAPKSRENLREYRYFCLEHVREYNKGWDYFKGYAEDEIYAHMREAVIGERPTWPSSKPDLDQKLRKAANFWGANFDTKADAKPAEPAVKHPIRDAFAALGLAFDVDFTAVKQQFRRLVKKYHPDINPNDPKASERFKSVNDAYRTLKNHFTD